MQNCGVQSRQKERRISIYVQAAMLTTEKPIPVAHQRARETCLLCLPGRSIRPRLLDSEAAGHRGREPGLYIRGQHTSHGAPWVSQSNLRIPKKHLVRFPETRHQQPLPGGPGRKKGHPSSGGRIPCWGRTKSAKHAKIYIRHCNPPHQTLLRFPTGALGVLFLDPRNGCFPLPC